MEVTDREITILQFALSCYSDKIRDTMRRDEKKGKLQYLPGRRRIREEISSLQARITKLALENEGLDKEEGNGVANNGDKQARISRASNYHKEAG